MLVEELWRGGAPGVGRAQAYGFRSRGADVVKRAVGGELAGWYAAGRGHGALD